MLRRDFISKIIEQMLNALARILKLDIKKEPEKFLHQFDELLETYFQLKQEDLALLLEKEEERDALLLDEKLKNYQIRLFIQAGFVFVQTEQLTKAALCIEIIQRIQEQHSHVFEFPSVESMRIDKDLAELKSKI